jgi:enamine deaminase RidA (YjgF/YER057c/UK114 family)
MRWSSINITNNMNKSEGVYGHMAEQRVSSGSPYEPKLGFSRAVRVGSIIAVSGTAPIGPDGKTVGQGDAAAQMRRCIEIVRASLEQLGASLDDVIRTRILLTSIADWQSVGLVHGEYFGQIRPACTVLQVSRFIDPDWLVELEVDAIVRATGLL